MTSLPVVVKLPFKGKRDYAHGTDIFNAAVEVATNSTGVGSFISNFDLVIRKGCSSNVVLFCEQGRQKPDRTFASFECILDENVRLFDIAEGEPLPVERVEFDEAKIFDSCTYDDISKTIRLANSFGFSTAIETVVILNKALHGRAFKQPVKWLFVRFHGPVWPVPSSSHGEWSIRLIEAFGVRLTKSKVYFNDKEVGTIWFSGVIENK